MTITTLHGDCREVLQTLPAGSVQCVVTSPPYYGLRKYGDDPREIGQEATPALYVAALVEVFRQVRRVLRDDGVVWLNLGDSYNAPAGSATNPGMSQKGVRQPTYKAGDGYCKDKSLKPKDLLGIPWVVAKALQEPYYTGRIAREVDRVWLAAMIDAEGTICGFRHERSNGAIRTGALVIFTNSSQALVDNAIRIWPGARYFIHTKEGEDVTFCTARKDCWRWQPQSAEDRAAILAELYPYLIAKKQQALVAWNLMQFAIQAKRMGRGGETSEIKTKREILIGLLTDLNHDRPVVFPSWLKEPPSLYEPGWYLRSDIVWAKSNCMPESVTDRPTRAHEYVFLLSKQARYFYDAAAIAEQSTAQENRGGANKVQDLVAAPGARNDGFGERWQPSGTRNRRTVWTIATQPYSGAHYATMPEALIAPCVLAGSSAQACETCGAAWGRVTEQIGLIQDRWSETNGHAHLGGTHTERTTRRVMSTVGFAPRCACPDNTGSARSVVLDPFAGSGTVQRVATRYQRDAIGIELNQEYIDDHIETRTDGVQVELFV